MLVNFRRMVLAIALVGFMVTNVPLYAANQSSGEAFSEAVILLETGNLAGLQKILHNNPTVLSLCDDDGWTLVHHAVYKEQREILAWLGTQGGKIGVLDTADQMGITPLMASIQNNDVTSSRILLTAKCNPNVINPMDRGRTALIYAIIDNKMDLVRLLADSGADLNLCDGEKLPPISWVAFAASLEMLKYMVNRGIDIHLIDGRGDDLIDAAIQGSKLENLAYLKSLGLKERKKS